MSDIKKYLPYGVLVLLTLIAVYFYYFVYSFHWYDRSSLSVYLILMIVFYGGYKFFQSMIEIPGYRVTPLILLGGFFLHLLFASLYFVGISGENIFLGLVLWFQAGFFLLMILFLWIILYLFGNTISEKLGLLSHKNHHKNHIISLSVGFFFFILGLFLIASLGLYNILGLSIVGIIFFTGALITRGRDMYKIPAFLKQELYFQKLGTAKEYLATSLNELHFLVLTLFLSVNFISVFRPYPIGWDDLGAYMNTPKLLTGAEGLLGLGNMYSWELYTGIGHILGNETFAFFLNSFSSLLVIFVLFIGFSYFKPQKETSFSYPLLGVLILMILPMSVFQLAKDMKLDYGLLFISSSAFFLTLFQFFERNNFGEIIFHKKYTPKIWLTIGILIGFAFSIKLTSLLLLLGVLVLIMYLYTGVGAYFMGVFGVIGVFSYAGLWTMLNVVFPSDTLTKLYFGGGALFLVIIFGWYMYFKNKLGDIKKMSVSLLFVLLGFSIALLPWGVKNFSELQNSGRSLSLGAIISGVSENYRPDFTTLYSQDELRVIESKASRGISSSGTTSNEDFGRYFGYEKGINNYLKLPWNLTFQSNQSGEFTDITFLFFVLLPPLFFVYRYKYPWTIPYMCVMGVLLLLYYIPNPFSVFITGLFSYITLPFGYIFIFLFYISLFSVTELTLKKETSYEKLYTAGLAFGSFYVFLWSISAFGIVWYGIMMYGVFLFLLIISLYHIEDKKYLSYFSYSIAGIVWIYILLSGLSHATSNLKNAGYLDYKLGQVNRYEAVVKYHPEYFSFLSEMNISDPQKQVLLDDTKQALLDVFSKKNEFKELLPVIAKLSSLEEIQRLLRELDNNQLGDLTVPVKDIQTRLYKTIIFPNNLQKNTKIVYRIGTFMKYYISENNRRVWDDNLLNQFDDFIYDNSEDIITTRLQKLGVGYLLLDLNAATIDNDERKDLTRRYENMLAYTFSSDLEFISGDSICYQFARDGLSEGTLTPEQALSIAGVNYGTPEQKREKKTACIVALYEVLSQNLPEKNKNYNYLIPYRNVLIAISKKKQEVGEKGDANALMSELAKYVGNGFKVLVKIPEREDIE